MFVRLRQLSGLFGLPKDRTALSNWAKRNRVSLNILRGVGGEFEAVSLAELPEDIQLAYQLQQAELAGLVFGDRDDAAYLDLQAKPLGVQEKAHARAAMLTFVVRHQKAGLTWPQIAARFKDAGFGEGPSNQTIKGWFKLVEGVDPANWPAALAPDYKGRTTKAPMTAAAWDEYCFRVAAWGRNGTGVNLKKAWVQVKAKAEKCGWEWPSYETVLREFRRQPVEQQRVLTIGAEAAATSITQRLPRTVEGLRAMEQVELDGREFKVKVRFEDGTIGCPWVIVYADRASNKVVGWAISNSENEQAVVEATLHMFETHGKPDRVVTDNGSGINSKRIMGGLNPLIRRKETKKLDWQVPGLFMINKIELRNCAPRKGWAKIVESVYSVLRHIDNDPVFNGAQRSGPNDAPNLNPAPVEMALFKAFIDQEIAAYNANRDTRAEGIKKGENRNEAFVRLSEGRIARWQTPLERRESRVKYKRVMVQQDGRIKFEGGVWGDETTQSKMLQHAGTWVLAGFDPKDYRAPIIIRGWENPQLHGRLLFDALPMFEPAKHNDEASRRRAVTEDRRAKAIARKYARTDIPERVAGLRAEVLANAGLAPIPVAPKVVQFEGRGAFPSDPALYNQNKPSQAKSLLAWLRPDENRTVSGGNR